jgi:predicted PurR-regulated permease PerM
MKKWVKVILIILAIIFVLIAGAVIYGYHTYTEIKDVMSIVNDNSMQQNLEALMNGDCSKLGIVETQMSDIKIKVKTVCNNLIVKFAFARGWVSDPNANKICTEINNPNNDIDKALNMTKEACANKTA